MLVELNEFQLEQLLEDTKLRGVRFDQNTIWPEGKGAFLADLLGEDATQGVEEDADGVVVDPDFVVVGQSHVAALNQLVANISVTDGQSVTVDFNHPLSGRTLLFLPMLVTADNAHTLLHKLPELITAIQSEFIYVFDVVR